jgi:hypothetical protein
MSRQTPRPIAADFEGALRDVFLEHSGMDLVENFCLLDRAKEKIAARFSRRLIRKRDIHPEIIAALKRMLATGQIKAFNVLGRYLMGYTAGEGRARVYALVHLRPPAAIKGWNE